MATEIRGYQIKDLTIDTADLKDGAITEPKLDIANAAVTDYILKWNGTKFEWVAQSGGGDMLKSTYDTDADGRVDKAESVDDGTNVSTAANVKDAVTKKHTQGTDDKIIEGDTSVEAIDTGTNGKVNVKVDNVLVGEFNDEGLSLPRGQLKFPTAQNASADANTLDDYEEGNWTMGVSFGGGTTGITYVYNLGYYTKIGNVVTVSGFLYLSSKGSSVGVVKLTGLPFTVVNNRAGDVAFSVYFAGISFANQCQAYSIQNTTTVTINEVTEAGVQTNLTNVNFSDTGWIMVNAVYRVT